MTLIALPALPHFQVSYDSTLTGTGGTPDGAALAQAVWDYCEYDLQRLSVLFGGITLPAASLPVAINVVPGGGGGSNNGSNFIQCNVNTGYTPEGMPALVVAELAEILMVVQGRGWIAAWSNGEALSRVLAGVLYPDRALYFAIASSWLNATGRPDWVSASEHTDGNFVSSGCGTLFLNWLAYQLGKRWTDIVQAGAPTTQSLAETATAVGVASAWASFSGLVTSTWPAGTSVFLPTDDPFPIGAITPPVPALYLRDNLADDGTTHAPPLSLSPDIIVRNAPVADPQTTFSTPASIASDTESDGVLDTQENHVYVRVWNRGADAPNVFATVYWAPPSTLVTPNTWNLLGSAYLPDVPGGSVVRVSNPGVVWPRDKIPPDGHYCFVATVGNADDPPPSPATFASFDDYMNYIEANSDVTWRNFDVVHVASPHPSPPAPPHRFGPWIPLPFHIGGAWDKEADFTLETIGGLPHGGRLAVEVPHWIARGLKLHANIEEHRDPVTDPQATRRARIHLAPNRLHTLGTIALPPKTRAKSHLLVHLPEGLAKPHRVAVRQLYRGREVGRITWLLVPKRKG